MNPTLKSRLIEELLEHLLNKDADELRPKPKMMGVEVDVMKEPKGDGDGDVVEAMHDGVKDEVSGDAQPDQDAMSAQMDTPENMDKMAPTDDMSDEDLEDLLNEYQK